MSASREARAIHLSIVIPAFDEAERIGDTIARVLAYLDAQSFSTELIVVLDGGRPGAEEAIADAAGTHDNVSVIDNGTNRGKGFSVRRGILASRGRFAIFVDADLSLPIENAGAVLASLEEGADVAIGSRSAEGSGVSGTEPPGRAWARDMFRALVRALAPTSAHDTQCGIKGFRRAAADTIFGRHRIDRFAFDVEVLWIARALGLRVAEVPVVCVYRDRSSLRLWHDGMPMVIDLLRIRLNALRGLYDKACRV